MSLLAALLSTLSLAASPQPLAPQDSPATVLPGQGTSDPRSPRLHEYLTAAAALGRWNGTALVAQGGEVLLHAGYGHADFEHDVPAAPWTRYRIASISKQFAATTAFLLAREGKLDLQAPISTYLPTAPERWSAITTDHLIHHTSGIPDYEEWFGGYTTQPYSDFMADADVTARIIERAVGMPLDFTPGESFHYSNSAYLVLGRVIAAAAGESFAAACRRRIFEPLGMRATSQDVDERILPHRARGYALADGLGRADLLRGVGVEQLVRANYQRMEPPQAEGGLVSTAADLYRWDQAWYGTELVTATEREELLAPGLGGYAFGWFVSAGPNGPAYEHSGGLPGFGCYLHREPATRTTAILLGNLEYLGANTMRDVLRIVRGEEVDPPRAFPVIQLEPAALARLAGTYETADGGSLGLRGGGTRIEVTWGTHRARAFALSDTELLLVEFPDEELSRLRFQFDDDLTVLTLESLAGELLLEGARF